MTCSISISLRPIFLPNGPILYHPNSNRLITIECLAAPTQSSTWMSCRDCSSLCPQYRGVHSQLTGFTCDKPAYIKLKTEGQSNRSLSSNLVRKAPARTETLSFFPCSQIVSWEEQCWHFTIYRAVLAFSRLARFALIIIELYVSGTWLVA